MKTASYEKKSTKIAKTYKEYNVSISAFYACIRFARLCNITLFLLISMIFLHSSAIACSSSDNNPTCAGFTAKNAHTIHLTF